MTHVDDTNEVPRRRRSAWRFVVGCALLGAAGVLLWMRRDDLSAALRAARRPAPGQALLLLACVAANVVLTAACLRTLLERFGRVGHLEMQALTASAALLNYLPMRPGMFGRIAWHKKMNGIAVRDTGRTIVEAALLSAGIALYLAAVSAVAMTRGVSLWPGVVIPLPVLLGAVVWRWRWFWARAALLRYVEVMVWAVRYHVSFAIIGSPLPPTASLAFACVSVIVTMVPIVGNGLGLREWAIGLLAPVLTAYRLELGVTADLVNRGAELLVIGGMGLAGIAWLTRRGPGR